MDESSQNWYADTITITTHGKGMRPVTTEVIALIDKWGITTGMCFLFLPHTSASITLCESYDRHSRADVESYFERSVPENAPWYKHTYEGPDDSPSHIRTVLSQSSIVIPIDNGQLGLGTWQGIYLFEHRSVPHTRKLKVRALRID